MNHALRARTWFAAAAVLAAVGLFVLDGAAAGGVCAAAMAVFVVGCFRGLSGEQPEDRTAGTGMFGGF